MNCKFKISAHYSNIILNVNNEAAEELRTL